MLKKLLSVSVFFAVLQLGMSHDAQAQKRSSGTYYTNALGMRIEFGNGGSLVGFSGKHFFTGNHAGEGQLLFGTGVFAIDLGYQYHAPIASAEGLQWYAGLGTQIAFYSGPDLYYDFNGDGINDYKGSSSTAFALVPVGGLDYKIAQAPINFSFDWRPKFVLTGGSHVTAGRFGLAARYTF
jgi:hypothetical protein